MSQVYPLPHTSARRSSYRDNRVAAYLPLPCAFVLTTVSNIGARY